MIMEKKKVCQVVSIYIFVNKEGRILCLDKASTTAEWTLCNDLFNYWF